MRKRSFDKSPEDQPLSTVFSETAAGVTVVAVNGDIDAASVPVRRAWRRSAHWPPCPDTRAASES